MKSIGRVVAGGLTDVAHVLGAGLVLVLNWEPVRKLGDCPSV